MRSKTVSQLLADLGVERSHSRPYVSNDNPYFDTPETDHRGRIEEMLSEKQATLDAAYAAHPERFVHRPPQISGPPDRVWINRPTEVPAPGATPGPEEVFH